MLTSSTSFEVMPFERLQTLQHLGSNMACNLKKAFRYWNKQDRVRPIVTDNAANIGVAIRDMYIHLFPGSNEKNK